MSNVLKFNNPIVVGTLTADPGTAENGTIYYNSTTGQFRQYSGGNWTNLSTPALNNHNVLVGDASNLSAAVDTNSVGDILADSVNGFTIKSGVITNSEINSSAAIALTKLAALTNHNRALQSDGSGFISESSVTSTELGYLSGVTSAIQTQLDGKLSLSGGTMSGNIAMGGNKLTGLGAGTTTGDSVRYEQAILVSGVNPFAADQSMGSHKLTNLANGTNPGDAVNLSQLNAASTGLTWLNSIRDPDLVNDSLSTPPGSPIYSLLYIIGASGTGAWNGLDGHAVWWDGTQWIDLSTGVLATSGQGSVVAVGDRFLVAASTPQKYSFTVTSANATAGAVYSTNGYMFIVQSTISGGTTLVATSSGYPAGASGTLTKVSGTGDATISFSAWSAQIGGGLAGENYKIATVTSNTPGSFTYTFDTPVNNDAVSDTASGSQHFGDSFTYTNTSNSWVDFSGPGKVVAGAALAYSGNTLNVQYDGVTIDLTGNQLEVKAGGISNTQVSASAAIALTKLAALTNHNRALQSDGSGFISESSVTSTELGFLSGVTSSVQTQLNGKASTSLNNLASTAVNASINPGSDNAVSLGTTSLRYTNVAALNLLSGASDLTLNANSGSNPLQAISSAFKRGPSSSRYVNEIYNDSITLAGSSSGVAVSAFTVAFATIDCIEISYRIKDTTSNAVRVGTIRVTTDGTNTSITDMFTETSDAGVSWTAAINGSNLEIRYTTTANNKTMRADVKQFLV